MSIFLKFTHSLLSSGIQMLCALMHGLLVRSCVFLANYGPKCQMSSGPYGPILNLRYEMHRQLRTIKTYSFLDEWVIDRISVVKCLKLPLI